MDRRDIGKTGISVFSIGLGAMPLSIEGRRPNETDGIKVIHAALDAGVTLIDTADVYCTNDSDIGHNERLIAKALLARSRPKEVLVTTKGGMVRPEGRWEVNGRPKHLRAACELSLKNLGQDEIVLYQLHSPDPTVPFLDSVGELVRMKEEGKIIHIGLSNVNSNQLNEALTITRVETVQNRSNPFEQKDYKSGLVKLCAEEQITFVPHSPVGGHFSHSKRSSDRLLGSLAAKYATSPYCVMLHWHLRQGKHILPIPGASKESSIQDSVKAVTLDVSASDLDQISGLDGAK